MNYKKSIIIKEINEREVERISKDSLKECIDYTKKERQKLSIEEKRRIKFRIIQK